jgi:uncharacterized protein (TIGR02271 family)
MADHRTQDTIIPLVEEEVRIDKRSVVTGKVRVRTVTDTVEEMARATLEGREVEVVRVPIDREVDAAPAVRTEGDVVIVPVVEEILVVEKRLVLKEELRLQPRKTEETVEVPVTLRKQQAVVERVGPEGPAQEEENQ